MSDRQRAVNAPWSELQRVGQCQAGESCEPVCLACGGIDVCAARCWVNEGVQHRLAFQGLQLCRGDLQAEKQLLLEKGKAPVRALKGAVDRFTRN